MGRVVVRPSRAASVTGLTGPSVVLALVALLLAGCGASTSTVRDTPSVSSALEGRLVYAWDGPTEPVIGIADAHGGDARELLTGAELPRWSPDGTRISVVAEGPQGLVFVGLVNPDGSDYTRLDSPDPTLNLGCNAWSPDGERLACEGWDDTDPTRNGIYTVRAADGGDLTRVTSAPDGTHDLPGSYSPDGRQIVFVRGDLSDEEHGRLMVVDAAGGAELQLTNQQVGVRSDWSPDGSSILTEAAGTLVVVPAEGGEASPLVLDVNGVHATRASWSPDGAHIVFSISADDSAPPDIYTADADGSNVVQVTDTPDLNEWEASWSQ